MVTTVVQLPERLRFLPLFLALWLLSYLGPHSLAAVADLLLRMIARILESLTASDISIWVVWVGMLPVAYAWAQWLLMRRCLSTAIPWALAVFVGTLLARLGWALLGNLDPNLLFRHPLLMDVFMALTSVVGATFSTTALMVFPTALCFGVATSVPQALVLPASKLWRALWIAIVLPTEFASTVLGEGLYRSFRLLYDPLSGGQLWIWLVAIDFVPRICSWLPTAVVSGLLMHVILRRSTGRVPEQFYTRFD